MKTAILTYFLLVSVLFAQSLSPNTFNKYLRVAKSVNVVTAPESGGIDTNAILMLHMDGTDGSQTFTDSSIYGHVMYPPASLGNAVISTNSPKFGTGSILTSGSTYLYTDDSTQYRFTNQNYTIEFWFKTTSTAGAQFWCTKGADYGGNYEWRIMRWHIDSSFRFDQSTTGASFDKVEIIPWTPTTNVWHHLAVSRQSSVLRVFYDGNQIGTNFLAYDLPAKGARITVGNAAQNVNPIGYIDEFRVSKGVSRYNANFTPRATPFTSN